MAKISVDSDFCQAHGRCYARFPQLFAADDEGRGLVRGDGVVPGGTQGAEIDGVCPEAAIAVE